MEKERPPVFGMIERGGQVVINLQQFPPCLKILYNLCRKALSEPTSYPIGHV
jgi:hypothetical protein